MPSKTFLFLRVLLFVILFCTSVFARELQKGLPYLNALRNHTGLIALHSNRVLNKAATSHAKYLIRHQQTGHYERKGQKYYTGYSPSQRVLKAGYSSSIVMENISTNTDSDKASIDTLFAAIYHRFVFLNFDKDEIGIGFASTKKRKHVKKTRVYDLGASTLEKLCKKKYRLKNGTYYIKGVCRDAAHMIPQSIFEKEKSSIALHNSKMVLYPYEGQKEVSPAFYNESPDPLPKYDVSGFPVSIQFNPALVKDVKLKSFRLYDNDGNEIKKTKILQAKNDPNHIFTRYEFALMPLARLEYESTYTTVFEASVDGVPIRKEWQFHTQTFKEKVYRISKNSTTLEVSAGESIILYMAPNHRKDLLKNYRLRGEAKATFLDQNTLKIHFPKSRYASKISLSFGDKRRVVFNVKALL
ncbi:MAG: CAP domain-containing protein [Epsilonproteobacteria bacterium]|nr:CAP domain-containing protein [Campylobacterota bacterium]